VSDTPLLPPLSPSEARQIDQTCDRFEVAWKARRPTPEEYLAEVGEPARAALLRQLLLVDWDYRRRAGEDPQAADYQARFPCDSAVIEEVRREMSEDTVSTQEGAGDANAPHTPWPGDRGSLLWVEADAGAETGPDRYALLHEVGHGGIGVVFLGRDRHLGREVAVKVLHERYGDEPEARRRFADEARIAAQLQHPAIPPVHDLGALPDGRPFLSMKLIKGQTLDILLAARPNPSQDRGRFVAVFEQVCQALAYAHAHHVIHRDLKPANVMVGAFGEVQVMDWGLAKVLRPRPAVVAADPTETSGLTEVRSLRDSDGSVTQAGSVLGTLAFMPPEQAAGAVGKVDARSDVFGLGGILAVILTGQPPFVGGSVETLRLQAARGRLGECFARLDACGADPDLVALCKRCLAADPAARPEDGGEVAAAVAALRQAADERARRAELERVRAEGERAAAQLQAVEQRKRRRVQLGLAAAVLLLVLIGGGAAWYLRQQHLEQAAAEARREAEQARQERERAHEVGGYLGQVGEHRRAQKWDRAWAALERAEGRLAGSTDEELLDRVRQARTDLEAFRRDQEMLAKLEEARLQLAAPGKDGFDRKGMDRLYRQAFAGYDLDLDRLTPEEAGKRVADCRLAEALIVALDHWQNTLTDRRQAARLREIANRADPNEWRRRLRETIGTSDEATVRRLGAERLPERLPSAAVVMLAYRLRDIGESKRAVEVLRQAQRDNPGDFWLCFELAAHASRQGQQGAEEAVRYFTAVLALRPGSAVVNYNLGTALHDQKKMAEAVAAYRKAIDLKPDYAIAYNNLGVALAAQQKLAEAVAAYRQAIDLRPDFAIAYNNLGNVLRDQKQLEEAVAAYRKAIDLKPDFSEAYCGLGAALHEQKKLEEAVAAFRKAIDLKPDYAIAYNNLGSALYDQKKLDEAVAVFRKAIDLKPDYANAYHNLGMVLRDQKKLEEAVAALRKAIDLAPDEAEAYLKLGIVLARLKSFDAAVAAFRQTIDLEPDYAEAYYSLGKVLQEQRKLDEAVAAFHKAIDLKPDYAEAHGVLGLSLRDMGRFVEALESLRRAQQLGARQPGWPTARSNALIRQVEPLAALERDLPSFLSGKRKPEGADQLLDLAQFCAHPRKQLYAASARFYAGAFTARATLADDLSAAHRYHAACSAALAGRGQGEDAAGLDANERARWHRQSLDWLRADHAAWARRITDGNPRDMEDAAAMLRRWQTDAGLGGVRHPWSLLHLPADERRSWQTLWADVAELLKKAVRTGAYCRG
jgi:tetratricopeptide (TPR) repeat protein